jgi:chromosome segregation protein
MFLKRLEIYGFKSFGTKSVLDFSDGNEVTRISAIVGPNGSGKSNIADAVRWVLGEQSSKMLRSKKNEDVIFCGSNSKPRGSYAEIAITLADKKSFTIEINGKNHELAEIVIARKLYRSGESEYLINGKKVRLLDIQQILASFGFGQSSYTVIGQGMVDRLLFFNPSERKVLFDEAAGVKQYEIKREQAVRKLEATDSNLIRLKDILGELEPQVINLRRLVKRAEGRKEIEKELAEIQNRYYIGQELELSTRIDSYQAEKAELNKIIVQTSTEIEEFDKLIEVTRKDFGTETGLAKIQEDLNRATTERDQYLQKVAYLEGQLNRSDQKREQNKNEVQRLIDEKNNLTEKVEFLKARIKEEKDVLAGQIAEKEKLIDEISQIENGKTNLNKSLGAIEGSEASEEIADLEAEAEKLKGSKQEIGNELYNLKRQLNSIEAEKEQRLEKTKRLEARNDSLRAEQKDNFEKADSDRKEKDKIIAELAAAEKKIAKVVADIAEIEVELVGLSEGLDQSQIEVFQIELEQIIEEFSEIQKSKKEEEISSFFGKLHGVFEKARRVVKGLNQKDRALFDQKLRDLRQTERELESTVSRGKLEIERIESKIFFLEQKNEQIEREIDDAKSELKKLAELEAEVLDPNKLTKLEADIDKISVQIEKVNKEISEKSKDTNQRKQVILSKINSFHQEEAELRRGLYEIELLVGRKANTIENQEKEIDASHKRLSEIDSRLSELTNVTVEINLEVEKEVEEKKRELAKKDEELSTLRQKLSEILSKQREQNQQSFEIERERRNAESQIMATQNELNRISLEEAKYATRFEDLKEEMKVGGIVLDRSTKGERLSQDEKDGLRVKMENLRRRLESIGGVDPETEAEYKELEQRSSEMAEQVNDLDKAKEDLERIIKELDGKIRKQFGEVFGHISSEFNRYFQILFDGGKADLTMGEDEEGNYGIEISANPPGKKLQSLNVLSGGERTLTSLALVFAILSINPSPFCLLDEVDAALDESNTVRFTKILKDLAHKTQFLVISHNRDTMKAADSLYGITMNRDHISKLISIRLAEALEKVA